MPDIDIGRIDIDSTLKLFRECTPRLLVVTDGALDAGPGGFGLSRFVSTLKNTTIHGMKPTVVTRPRFANAPDDAFDDLAISTFDVIFLFGINTTGDPLSGPALDRVKEFMQDGGGVFATGDHEDLGTGMSGAIPRVRNMRYWALAETPNASDASRLTTNLSGVDRVFEFDDQADNQPQRLYANFAIPSDYLLFTTFPPVSTKVRLPHPLVRMADGSALDVYPDHAHEGECRIPTDFSTTFDLDGQTLAEWPNQSFFARPRPRAVASTMSFGNGFDSPGKDAVAPRAFISIAAYNGQAANVGRVVTDATWHHYVNINLNGMLVGNMPNADLQRIQNYWSNLATWLMPATTRMCLWPWIVIKTLREHALAEEIRIPIDRDLDLGELHTIGQAVLSAAGNLAGGVALDLFADVLSTIIEPERVSKPADEPGVSDAVLETVAAVVGRYVVGVSRAAATGELAHDDDGFSRAVRQIAPKLVDSVLESQRAQLKRRAEGLEILDSSFRRELVPV